MHSIKGSPQEKKVISRLVEEINYLRASNTQKEANDLWSGRIEESLKKFLSSSGAVNINKIRNFRRLQIFVSELPTYQSLFPLNWMHGGRRGQRYYAEDRLRVLNKEKNINYLERYPIDLIGNPHYFKIGKYRFNERWTRHIRYLHLASIHLSHVLGSGDARVLDIGGGYGIFSKLLKSEFGNVISAVVEFPEQLLLAYYYLAMNFPEARINTFKEINEAKVIDRDFVRMYDFLLIPTHCYSKIQKGAFNIITNFNSLGEMSEKWFNAYLDGDVFKSAKYFFTLNRFESRPTYNTNLNILDYRLGDFQRLHFQVSPLFSKYYVGRYLFLAKQEYFSSQCFEFIGERKG